MTSKYEAEISTRYVPNYVSDDGLTRTTAHYLITEFGALPQELGEEALKELRSLSLKDTTEQNLITKAQQQIANRLPKTPNGFDNGAVNYWNVKIRVLSREDYNADELNKIAEREARELVQKQLQEKRQKEIAAVREELDTKLGNLGRHVGHHEYDGSIVVYASPQRRFKRLKSGDYNWAGILAAAKECEQADLARKARAAAEQQKQEEKKNMETSLKLKRALELRYGKFYISVEVTNETICPIVAALRATGVDI